MAKNGIKISEFDKIYNQLLKEQSAKQPQQVQPEVKVAIPQPVQQPVNLSKFDRDVTDFYNRIPNIKEDPTAISEEKLNYQRLVEPTQDKVMLTRDDSQPRMVDTNYVETPSSVKVAIPKFTNSSKFVPSKEGLSILPTAEVVGKTPDGLPPIKSLYAPGTKEYEESVRAKNIEGAFGSYLVNPIGRFAGGVEAGVANMAEGIAGAGQQFGAKIGKGEQDFKQLADRAKEWTDELNKELSKGRINPNGTFLGDAIAGLSDLTDNVASGVGSQMVFIPIAAGSAFLSSILGKFSPRVANLFGASVSSFLESGTEAGSVYRQMLEGTDNSPESKLKADKAATQTFAQNILLNTILNKLNLDAYSSEGQMFKRSALAAFPEAFQEGSQQIISNVAAGKPAMEGVGISSLVGLLLGGAGAFSEHSLPENASNEAELIIVPSIQGQNNITEPITDGKPTTVSANPEMAQSIQQPIAERQATEQQNAPAEEIPTDVVDVADNNPPTIQQSEQQIEQKPLVKVPAAKVQKPKSENQLMNLIAEQNKIERQLQWDGESDFTPANAEQEELLLQHINISNQINQSLKEGEPNGKEERRQGGRLLNNEPTPENGIPGPTSATEGAPVADVSPISEEKQPAEIKDAAPAEIPNAGKTNKLVSVKQNLTDAKMQPEQGDRKFDFLANDNLRRGKALKILEKKISDKGIVKPTYKWIESFPRGLNPTQSSVSNKMVLNNYIINTKAELDYYNYLENGGKPYSEHLEEERKKKADEEEKLAAERKIKEENRKIQAAKAYKIHKENINNSIKELLENGPNERIQRFNEKFQKELIRLGKKRKSQATDDEIEYNKRMIQQTIDLENKNYRIAKEKYKIENGQVVPKYSYNIGDKVIVDGFHRGLGNVKIATEIVDIKDHDDSDTTYIVADKPGISNKHLNYESLTPENAVNVDENLEPVSGTTEETAPEISANTASADNPELQQIKGEETAPKSVSLRPVELQAVKAFTGSKFEELSKAEQDRILAIRDKANGDVAEFRKLLRGDDKETSANILQPQTFNVGDTVIVKGKNGNPDFPASFRGYNLDGTAHVYEKKSGSSYNVNSKELKIQPKEQIKPSTEDKKSAGIQETKQHGSVDFSENTVNPKVEKITPVTFYDALQVNQAPKIAIQTEYGETREVYDPASKKNYYDKSDETSRPIRWGVYLSDGRKVSLDGLLRITQPELWEKSKDLLKGKPLQTKNEFIISKTLDTKAFNKLLRITLDGIADDDIYDKVQGELVYNPDKINTILKEQGSPLAGLFNQTILLNDGAKVNILNRSYDLTDLKLGTRKSKPLFQKRSPQVKDLESTPISEIRQQFGLNENLQGEPKNLIAHHNISEQKLYKVDKLGGMPMPSLAISRTEYPMENFGEITLIASPDMIDPKFDRTSKIFNADAYTPKVPSPTNSAYEKISKIIESDAEKLISARFPDYLPKWRNYGNLITEPILEGNGEFNKDVQTYFLLKNHPEVFQNDEDSKNTYQYIKEHKDEFINFVLDLEDKIIAKQRLFKGFSYSGNRLYRDYTLNNIIADMKKDIRGGENFFYGIGSVRAQVAKQFKNIKDIQKDREKLIPKSDMDKLKDEIDKEASVIDEGQDHRFWGIVADGIKERSLRSDLEQYAPTFTKFQELQEFLNKLKNLPSEYFEVKLLRGVGLHEFAGAVVPKDIGDRARKILKKAGLEIIEYDGTYKDRIEKINSFNEAKFQKREESEMDSIVTAAMENGTYLKAPNGADTKLNPRQWAQVRTKSFKDWFGDWENSPETASKVVDENGEPLVVYHGTTDNFTEFKAKESARTNSMLGTTRNVKTEAFFFTPNKDVAKSYAENRRDFYNKEFSDKKVLDTFLAINNIIDLTNPKIIDKALNKAKIDIGDELGIYADSKGLDYSDLISRGEIEDTDLWKLFDNPGNINKLKEIGFNGAMINDITGISYVAFYSNQIKSATENTGTFDSNNPDIRYQIPAFLGTENMSEIQKLYNYKKFLEDGLAHLKTLEGTREINKQIIDSQAELNKVNRKIGQIESSRKTDTAQESLFNESAPQETLRPMPKPMPKKAEQLTLFYKNAKASQEIATEYANTMIEKLKKSFPDTEVVIDEEAFQSALEDAGAKGTRPYGFYHNGKIYLDPVSIRLDTPIHEFGHVWYAWAKGNRPDLINRLKGLVKQETELLDEIKRNYGKISNDTLLEEAIVTAIGRKGAQFNNITDEKQRKSLVDSMREALTYLWNAIKRSLKLVPSTKLEDMTLEQFCEQIAGDLLSGKKFGNIGLKEAVKMQTREENINDYTDLSNLELDQIKWNGENFPNIPGVKIIQNDDSLEYKYGKNGFKIEKRGEYYKTFTKYGGKYSSDYTGTINYYTSTDENIPQDILDFFNDKLHGYKKQLTMFDVMGDLAELVRSLKETDPKTKMISAKTGSNYLHYKDRILRIADHYQPDLYVNSAPAFDTEIITFQYRSVNDFMNAIKNKLQNIDAKFQLRPDEVQQDLENNRIGTVPKGTEESTTKGYNKRWMNPVTREAVTSALDDMRTEFDELRNNRVTDEQVIDAAMKMYPGLTDAAILSMKPGTTLNVVQALANRIYAESRAAGALEARDRAIESGNQDAITSANLDVILTTQLFAKIRAVGTETARTLRIYGKPMKTALLRQFEAAAKEMYLTSPELSKELEQFVTDTMKYKPEDLRALRAALKAIEELEQENQTLLDNNSQLNQQVADLQNIREENLYNISRLNERINELTNQISDLESKANALEITNMEAVKEYKKLDKLVYDLVDELDKANAQITDLQQQVDALSSEITVLKNRIAELEKNKPTDSQKKKAEKERKKIRDIKDNLSRISKMRKGQLSQEALAWIRALNKILIAKGKKVDDIQPVIKRKDFDFLHKVMYWRYQAMLSLPIADMRNIIGNSAMLGYELASLATSDIKHIPAYLTGLKRGAEMGWKEAAKIVRGQEAQRTRFIEHTTHNTDNFYNWVPTSKATKIVNALMPLTRMEAEDALFWNMAREARLEIKSREVAAKLNQTPDDALRMMRDLLEGGDINPYDAKILDEAEEKFADFEGTPEEKDKKLLEFLHGKYEAERNDLAKAVREADEYADYLTFRKKSKVANWMAKGLNWDVETPVIQKTFKFLGRSLVMPFVKVPLNIISASIDFSPVGFIKLANKNRTFEERKDIRRRAIAGSILISTIGSLIAAGLLHITGEPPEDKDQAEWFTKMGFRPYMFYIKGTDGEYRGINYQALPGLSTIFMLMGNFLTDAYSKNPKKNDKAWYEKIFTTTFATINSISNQSFLQGVNQFFGALKSSDSAGDYFANIGTGLLPNIATLPKVVKQEVTGDRTIYRTNGFADKVKARLGIYDGLEPVIGIDGNAKKSSYETVPIITSLSTGKTNIKENQVAKFFADRPYLNVPLVGRTVLNPETDQPVSDREYTEYAKLVGRYFMADIADRLQDLESMNIDEAQEIINRAAQKARKYAKRELF